MEHPTPASNGPEANFAAVLVDAGGAAARRRFDYSIPPHLRGTVQPGSLVVVPFGRRVLRGVVLELLETPAVPEAKPIRGLYPGAQYADPSAGDLAAFIARRYACSLIEAYRAVLPPGISGRVSRRSRAATTDDAFVTSHRAEAPLYRAAPDAQLASLRAGASRQATALGALLTAGQPLGRDQLGLSPAAATAALSALVSKGLVVVEGTVPAPTAPPPVAAMLGRTGPLTLTEPQSQAITSIRAGLAARRHSEFLLLGVTGSGKTEVYLQAIADVLSAGGQALVLVPEISLTPQTISRFEARFPGQVALLHSRLPDRERARAWRRLAAGERAIAVGPRSALFAPMPNLRLVVVDEEHEPSYKQEELPRYDAREVARERARLAGAVLIFGSATPSLETYHRATAAAAHLPERSDGPRPVLLTMADRVEAGQLPAVELIDLRRELETGNRSVLSRSLQAAISERLDRGEQTILFLNRRGHSTFVLCRECGYVARCPDCDVSLVLHSQEALLRCHHCGYEASPPATCPACGGTRIRYFGTGTERLEAQVREMYTHARLARLDSDIAAQRGRAEAILAGFARRELDILIGTQMVGKGLDFPGVTLVGVIAADTALNFPDFRAAERTFGLVTQVAGRAGRGDRPGLVIVQSYSPEHYSLQHAVRQDYSGFAAAELAHRRELCYPPYSHLALFRIAGANEQLAAATAQTARAALVEIAAGAGALRVLGPSPAPLYRLQGRYRWNIVLSGTDPMLLADVCSSGLDALLAAAPPSLRVSADVDPQTMM